MGSVVNDRLSLIANRKSLIAYRASHIAYRVSHIAYRVSRIAYRWDGWSQAYTLHVFTFQIFQSLSRDSGHLDQTTDDQPQATGHGRPTTGNRPRTTDRRRPTTDDRPQATGHGRPTTDDRPRTTDDPRSGLGGFELSSVVCGQWSGLTFQSLSRDSGHLNLREGTGGGGWSTSCFNPSVGIRGI